MHENRKKMCVNLNISETKIMTNLIKCITHKSKRLTMISHLKCEQQLSRYLSGITQVMIPGVRLVSRSFTAPCQIKPGVGPGSQPV